MKKNLTVEQAVALENHCRLACEATHPRFVRRSALWPYYSVVLTVNSGYE